MAQQQGLPIGHTCGNSMDVPMYEEKETMMKSLLIAARLCGEIDADGDNPTGGRGLDAENTQLTNLQQGSVSLDGRREQIIELAEFDRSMEDVQLDFKGQIVAGEQVEQSQEAAQAMYDF